MELLDPVLKIKTDDEYILILHVISIKNVRIEATHWDDDVINVSMELLVEKAENESVGSVEQSDLQVIKDKLSNNRKLMLIGGRDD